MKKSKKRELYIEPLKRIAKKSGITRISKEALEEIANRLETHAKLLSQRAKGYARKSKRDTIKLEDVKKAEKEAFFIR
ncbi:histone [Candidatus Pacearchaeota archaeon CG_4_9_14_3_um_filter_31_7]|nr:MAG: hypothetical protein AUJ10_02900 [Candidatus Pacearchaeota archaeon CG1_02_31_27]PIN92079.1 MAG: histone [Candidatus Pacearchaeota archaeon CG10_big_fil_rev_8_21_14_0_10_31_59]PIZ80293.1 MAG: histone [Candidatus Pacearchaeota archaeon CG_4_10_14_0_2_um_filter_31_10]PJA70749.1 MAG: histone [Candidatus Pacearchaeota archaeon CG_4_9_14_3_um_filter_31_7]